MENKEFDSEKIDPVNDEFPSSYPADNEGAFDRAALYFTGPKAKEADDLIELAYGIYYKGWADAKGLKQTMEEYLIKIGRIEKPKPVSEQEYIPFEEAGLLHKSPKVITSIETMGWGSEVDKKMAAKYLKPGVEYLVEKIESSDWGYRVYLVEFPGKRFNIVHFLIKNPKYVAPVDGGAGDRQQGMDAVQQEPKPSTELE